MAWYKYDKYIDQNNDKAFDAEHKPGDAAPFSGIYRCMGCDHEVASNEGEPLPPQNKHQHQNQTPIRWKLVVYAAHQPR